MTLRRAGKILIWIGVLAWAPYAVLKYLLRYEVPVLPFLTVHLLGVIPGSVLSRLGKRRAGSADPEVKSR